MRRIIKCATGFVLLGFSFLFAGSLKVLPVFNFQFESSKRSFIKRAMPVLRENEVVFVEQDPDLVLVCAGAMIHGGENKNICEQFSNYPIVILDEEESASIDPDIRNYLKWPNVKALYKNTVLRAREDYNKPTVWNKYHFKLINDSAKKLIKEQPLVLMSEELQKIQCFLWDKPRSSLGVNFSKFSDKVIDFNKHRLVDVFFAGNVNQERPPGWHRARALDALKKIQGYNIIAQDGHVSKKQYFDFLKNSKIAVSPWGNGEWCWRDFEAIYCGAVVIKPDTSFVQGVPDLYQNDRYYVPCKADFSDLEEKISCVLNNYSQFMEMRKNARKLLMDSWDYEKHAKRLAEMLKSIASIQLGLIF